MYWLTGILGAVFAIAPWIFGYSSNITASWTSFIFGIAVVAVSIIEGMRSDREQWEYWTAGILGVLAILAPFILGFGSFVNAMWSSVILGILIVVFAGSRLGAGQWRKT